MKYLVFSILFFISFPGDAQLTVAQIFSDNMILQRNVDIPIWGWSTDENSQVTIKFDRQSYSTKVKDGTWQITLPPHAEGGDYKLIISGLYKTISFSNIVFGDVWLCGGQSNMEFFTEKVDNGLDEVNNANFSDIRLFDVPHKIAQKPVIDLEEGQWEECTAKTVSQFSAVGYFFGRKLHQKLKIPIGLLGDNYGGTVIETWMSPTAFAGMPVYKKQIEQLGASDLERQKKETKTKFDKWLLRFTVDDMGRKNNKYLWKNLDCHSCATMTLPTQWESSEHQELKNLDGVVWLEKEFTLSSDQANNEALLSLGPIDDSDITWINGVKVGEMQNRYNKDRNYPIKSTILHIGINKIVVRVEDYIGGGGIYGQADKLFLEVNHHKIPLTGKWHYKIGYTADSPMPTGVDFGPNSSPTLLYNGMIAPIQKFPIKGVIWYQGESNSYRAVEYKQLKPRWLGDWRQIFSNPKLPIIWVQLANYQQPQKDPSPSTWAELREAQTEALLINHTAMITAIDIGDAKDIHPTNKQEVGRRLALAALQEVYKKRTNYKSPRFDHIQPGDHYIDIQFKDTYQGLSAKSKYGYVTGFTIAGKDKVFHWAKAEILSPTTIRVFSPQGIIPIAVRYAWANNPKPANIFNSEHFPLLPFRTDNWKLSTDGIHRQ